MTRLILTFDDSGAGALKGARLADCVIPFGLRFVWGRLQSRSELDTSLSSRPAMRGASTSHWLDNLTDECFEDARSQGLGLIEFCEGFEAVELWIDPEPNAQLQMIWLLDYLRSSANVISRLALVQTDFGIGGQLSKEVATLRPQAVPIRDDHLEIAAAAWALARANAGKLVRTVGARSECISLPAEYRCFAARRTSHARLRTWRDGNADIGADIGRSRTSLRGISGAREAQ
jgi:hypothetical protein